MSLAKNALNYDKLGLFKFRIITGGRGLYHIFSDQLEQFILRRPQVNRKSIAQRRWELVTRQKHIKFQDKE